MRKKRKAQSSSVSTTDRLTALPDAIRHHILSFLPMEDCIRASSFSKDWKSTTTSLVNLDFNQEVYERRNPIVEEEFVRYINRMLLNRDRVSIQRFSLFFRFDDNPTTTLNINTWIGVAVRSNMQEFCICDGSENFDKLPSCLYNFTNLKVLELLGVCIKLPTVVGFPKLRKLLLMFDRFYEEGVIERFVSSSPVLEEMGLTLIHSYHLRNCTIDSGTLRVLRLWVYESPTQINISTPNLRYIYFDNVESPTFSPETLGSLLNATFKIRRPWSELLKRMTNLVELSLRSCYIEYMFRYNPIYMEQSPCPRLKVLGIEILSAEHHLKVLMILLQIYPNLVTLSIKFMVMASNNAGSLLSMETPLKKLNRRMLKCLKTIQIINFGGTNKELLIIRYFLKSANALDRMCISYSSDTKENVKMCRTTKDEILTSRKASFRAKIVFL